MKHPCLPALIALSAALLLSACTTAGGSTDSPPAADTTIEALRARYEAELATLRAELDALHTEDEAQRRAFEARIEALEATLERLSAGGTPGGSETRRPPLDSNLEGTTQNPAEAPETAQNTASTTVASPRETVAPPEASSGENPPDAVFYYRLEDSGVVITGFAGNEEEVVIPADIGGRPVVRIADNAFAGTGVRVVTIPSTVTHIGWFAFYGCTVLETVVLPASVSTIDYGAFDVCPALTIHAPAGSYGEAYAKAYGVAWVALE